MTAYFVLSTQFALNIIMVTTTATLAAAAVQTYHYNLDAGACHDPLRLRYSYHVRKPVDLEAMQAAAKQLLGIHDFTQFSNDSVERLRRNPVKTLLRYDVVPVAHNHVRLEVRWLISTRAAGRCQLSPADLFRVCHTVLGRACAGHVSNIAL